MESVRVDRWLCATRVFRSRNLASEACVGGRVKLNGGTVKAHHPLRVEDEVVVETPRGLRILQVKALAEKRLSAPLARELYEDNSPEPAPRDPYLPREPSRPQGEGRPTKRDRRALNRFRGQD
ncbi:MAG: RNA-binding S4 domain-containing protein [bacterium]|nr:RNA-binding S4 domain-containing protein [bacterium]